MHLHFCTKTIWINLYSIFTYYGIVTLFVNSQQYITIEEDLNFYDADRLCLFRYDTHLASIHSNEDFYDALNTINLTDSSPPGVWIGLKHNHYNGDIDKHVWQWEDGTIWDYGTEENMSPWDENEPNGWYGQCVRISTEQDADTYKQWTDTSCRWDTFRSLCAHPEALRLIDDPSHYIRKPYVSNVIGLIDILDEIYIEFDIEFKSFPPNGSGSILHFGSGMKEQFPAIFVDGTSKSLITNVSVVSNTNIVSNNMPLELFTTYQYRFHLTQSNLTTKLKNLSNSTQPPITISQTIDSHSIIMDREMYIGNPWNNRLFEAEITNLYVATSNQHQTSTSDAFNYACSANRWTNYTSGISWATGSNCAIKYETYADASAWLGYADQTSINWIDYKIEIKFVINETSSTDGWWAGILLRTQRYPNPIGQGYLVALMAENAYASPNIALYNVSGDARNVVHLESIQPVERYTEHTLRVEARHNNFAVFWNNEFQFTATHEQFSHGSIGLNTFNATVTFTSVRITFNSDGKLLTVPPTVYPTANPTPQPTSPTYYQTQIPTYTPTHEPTTDPTRETQPPTLDPITSTDITHVTTGPSTLMPSKSPTTTTRQGIASHSTTNTLNTESEELHHVTSSTETITRIVLVAVLLGCICCILIVACIYISVKQRSISKHKKTQMDLSNKTLTELNLGETKIMHYIDIEAGSPLYEAQTALPAATPGAITPGAPTTAATTTPGFTTPDCVISISKTSQPYLRNDMYESSSSDNDNAESDQQLLGDETKTKGEENNYEQCDEKKRDEVELKDDVKPLYHEKQKWELCLLHALNSLLQREEFTHKSLDNICKLLAPDKMINPHKSILQTGNYDANVLMMALGNVNIDVQWYDARKANELDLDDKLFLESDKSMEFVGFILNNPQKAIFGIFSRRHWLAINKIDGYFYNLDSKLPAPKKYNDIKELTGFLVDVLTTNNAELMICRRKKKERKEQEIFVD